MEIVCRVVSQSRTTVKIRYDLCKSIVLFITFCITCLSLLDPNIAERRMCQPEFMEWSSVRDAITASGSNDRLYVYAEVDLYEAAFDVDSFQVGFLQSIYIPHLIKFLPAISGAAHVSQHFECSLFHGQSLCR